MPNGRQIAELNYRRFLTWRSALGDADFKALQRRGILNRTEIAKACSFAKSCLGHNPRIKESLLELEDDLRSRGVLPPRSSKMEGNGVDISGPSVLNDYEGIPSVDVRRVNSVDNDFLLLEENRLLRARLEEISILREILVMTGRVPR